MSLLGGLFNYSKPGPGVDKNGPKKKRFFYFLELFGRKFWKLLELNLLYLLCCIPVVTIGPATCGLVYILRNFANEKPVFMVSDFFDAFKSNFKQGFVLGLLDIPTSGEYYLDGENTSDMTDDELSEIRNKEIGFIFQGFNLIPSLTAQANVELPLTYRGMPAAERHKLSLSALERVGLGHRLTHLPKQMSGGQQQRVAIARAVAARPPIILADEPTGNLDSRSGAEVMKILHELNDEGRTVILITHDNGIAEEAKRVIRIQDGKVVEDYRREAISSNS